MTQKDLADAMGSVEQIISKFERVISVPSAKAIMLLCKALQVTLNELYLDKSDCQGWQSEKLEHKEQSIEGLADHIKMVQAHFAKVEKASADKGDKSERAYLEQVIQMYMWNTDHFR